jgi:hypothetical protein
VSRNVYDNYQHPRGVVHRPLHPARRESTPGEGIYLDMWVDWCTRNPYEWRAIFDTTGPVRQRAASVAASFMVFMGCNGGYAFSHEAERYAQQQFFFSRESAFLAAWAVYNARTGGVNGGLRTSEFMLAPAYPYVGDGGMSPRLDWKLVPNITQEDNDILESMVRWWAGPAAKVMRSIAEPLIESEKARMRSGMFRRPAANDQGAMAA